MYIQPINMNYVVARLLHTKVIVRLHSQTFPVSTLPLKTLF